MDFNKRVKRKGPQKIFCLIFFAGFVQYLQGDLWPEKFLIKAVLI